jgi:PleD family two-component response regulator
VQAKGQDSIDLMRMADQALYCAKRSGRNRVACSESISAKSL